MRATGYVRRLDDLGRVVIPIELRRVMHLEERDALAVYVDSDCVVLKKYAPTCVFCGEARDVALFHDKYICPNCLEELCARR